MPWPEQSPSITMYLSIYILIDRFMRYGKTGQINLHSAGNLFGRVSFLEFGDDI
jgi:hypothetical protein